MSGITIPLKDRLSFRQAIGSVLVALGIGFILSFAQLVFDYLNHKNEFESTIEVFLDAAKKSAAHTAYNMDSIGAEQLSRGLVSYIPVVKAEIRDDEKKVLASSESESPKKVSVLGRWLFGGRSIIENQLFIEEQPNESVGTLIVVVDSARTADGFLKRAGAIFLSAVARNAILTVALIIVFHLTLTNSILRLHGALQGGRTDQRIPVFKRHRNDELGSLIREFNKHLDIIEKQHREISRAKENLMSQVENRTRELKKKSEQALHASEAKSEFLAMMTHEIRTPMSAVLGVTKLLNHSQLNYKQRQYVNTIKTCCESLVSIISDILDYARLERDSVELNESAFSLRDLFRSIGALMGLQAGEKGLVWDVSIDPLIPDHLFGDGAKLKQVIINLVNNAIKFTEQGKISLNVVFLSEKNDVIALRFTVVDTGIGVSEEYREKIFDDFYQVKGSQRFNLQGTGIGLTICKKIIALMEGTIGVEDNRVSGAAGQGSSFFFTVNFLRGVDAFSVEEEGGNPHFQTLNIMVVEDNGINQEVLAELLRLNGHRVITADNGSEAVEKVFIDPPDVILMDVRMPVMNGYDATRLIRSCNDVDIASIPIIGVTANAGRGDFESGLSAGMNDIVEKPISLPELYHKIETLLAGEVVGQSHQSATHGNFNQHLNVSVIDQHVEGLGKERAVQLMNKALESCREKTLHLVELTKKNESAALVRESHALSGIAKNFGFSSLANISSLIEELAENNDIISIGEVLKELTRMLDEVDLASKKRMQL